MIRVGEVVEDGKIDGKDADCSDGNRDSGNDPVDAREARPPEHEHADRHACALDTCKVESSFRCADEFPMLPCNLLLIDAEDRCEQTAYAHRSEDGVGLLQAEAMVALKDERDGGQRQVKNGPGERHPETKPEDDRFGEKQMKRSIEGDADHLPERRALFVSFNFPSNPLADHTARRRSIRHVESVVSCSLARFVPFVQDLCFPTEEYRAPGFFHYDADESDHGAA